MQFLLERCTYPHMNLPSDTLFYFPAPMTMNQLRKVGTWFLEREDNDPCRETYTLGSYHNIHQVREPLQSEVLENSELLIKSENSLVVSLFVPPTAPMSSTYMKTEGCRYGAQSPVEIIKTGVINTWFYIN